MKIMWCLKDPNGNLCLETLSKFKKDVWEEGFDIVADKHSRDKFATVYWKKWDASIHAAEKLGWKFVKIKITEMKP